MKSLNTNFLFEQVSGASLGLLRILFGIFMLKDFMKFYNYFVNSLSKSDFLITYDGFHWLTMLPTPLLYFFFGLMFISCIGFILGIHYRLNALFTFIGFTYIFLIDHGHYNNHFYLYCMLHFFFLITDANRWGALDKQTTSSIPYWQLFLFKFQIFVVYFYGSIAKMESDWFQGFPLRYWLHMVSEKFGPPISSFLQTENAAYFLSYGGFLFDLVIGFMLFSPRLRRIALLPVFIFHTSNHFLWDIGTFPPMMLAICVIFFLPDWPDRAFNYLKNKKLSIGISFIIGLSLIVGGTFFYNLNVVLIGTVFGVYYLFHDFRLSFFKWFLPYHPQSISNRSNKKEYIFNWHKTVISFISIWIFLQLTIPLRHRLIPGNPSWTGE